MKYNCDLISDLLPLYKDDICSEASKKIVEEHLAECADCKKMLNSLNDFTIDEKIVKEKDEVINSQARFFKRKSALAGSIIAMIFAIPILVCLIVNLATGAGLTWFFIVLAGILVAASLIVVPLMVPENKMFTTMASFTGSVLLLLGVICIYSGGNWFLVAASSTLFGLTMLFAPFIAYRRPVNAYVKNHKGLAIMCACTAAFVLMMFSIGMFVGMKEFFPMAFAVSMPLVGLCWAIFAIIRYLRFNACVKTGLCVASAGVMSCLISVLGPAAEASVSRTGVTYSSGVSVPPLTFVVIGLVIAGIGFLVGKNKGGKK
ncbi:zf-HC2 domain-containing protein [Butyrivibrio sp. AE2032]|uniref:zf-HC2 domain-containing protein n=1 Tax=Butyrivibrio sp. AE2032 TaxID=1458463 RepID=UPI000AA4CBF5|nr:zf-HC2 domain-containing protein [Butyrivibrio sp. AE2032]